MGKVLSKALCAIVLALGVMGFAIGCAPSQQQTIEIDGQTYSLEEFGNMLIENNLLIEDYMGKEAVIHGKVEQVNGPDSHYNIDGQRVAHDNKNGYITMEENYKAEYNVDISDDDAEFAKTLQKGDWVTATARFNGIHNQESQIDLAFTDGEIVEGGVIYHTKIEKDS